MFSRLVGFRRGSGVTRWRTAPGNALSWMCVPNLRQCGQQRDIRKCNHHAVMVLTCNRDARA